MNTCKNECIAESFRDNYPNYSFTVIGYSVSPRELNRQYQELVNISYSDPEEVHTCKTCGKQVFIKEHR